MDNYALEDVALSNSDINNDQTINILDIISITNIILSGNNQCELRIDLSLEWEIQDNLSYFDYEELTNIIDNQIAELDYLYSIIVIHDGKIVAENYYNGSINTTRNIWSVTKSFIATLVGQAIEEELLPNQYSNIDHST